VIPTLLAQTAPDSGSPGYVVAAVVVAGVLVLSYLVIVAYRVRDSARRLEALEARLDASAATRGDAQGVPEDGAAVREAEAVAAAAQASGDRR
jgi:hypothetical protein